MPNHVNLSVNVVTSSRKMRSTMIRHRKQVPVAIFDPVGHDPPTTYSQVAYTAELRSLFDLVNVLFLEVSFSSRGTALHMNNVRTRV